MLKAQNEPLGGFYGWMFSNIPGMQLFRDSSKFAVLVAAGYAVLIAAMVEQCLAWLRNPEDEVRAHQMRLFSNSQDRLRDSWTENRYRITAVVCLMALAGALLFGARADIAGNMGGTSKVTRCRRNSRNLVINSVQDEAFGRVLWLPTAALGPLTLTLIQPSSPSTSFLRPGL